MGGRAVQGRFGWHASIRPSPARDPVVLVRSSDKTVSQVARELGLNRETLRQWVKQDRIDQGELEGLTSSERDERRRLRREVAELKLERDLLVQAAAFSPRRRPGDPLPVRRSAQPTVTGSGGAAKRWASLQAASMSSFYDWHRRGPGPRQRADQALLAQIRRIHRDSGAPTAPRGSTPSCRSPAGSWSAASASPGCCAPPGWSVCIGAGALGRG